MPSHDRTIIIRDLTFKQKAFTKEEKDMTGYWKDNSLKIKTSYVNRGKTNT